MKRHVLGLLFLSALAGWIDPSVGNPNLESLLTIEVTGLKNSQGNVCLSLFVDERGFPGQAESAIASRCIQAEETSVKTQFAGLTPGRYAIAVIHDADSDGKLDTGFLGFPVEGFGFSRNPRITIGAPSFQDTALLVTGEFIEIQIDLRYLL